VSKIFYVDVETTGTNYQEHDIIQLAGIIEISGKIVDRFCYDIKPYRFDNVSEEALKIQGITLEDLQLGFEPAVVYGELIRKLEKYVDRYNKADKFSPAGYNTRFDCQFLKKFFERNNDKYYGSWFNWNLIDPFPVLHFLDYMGVVQLNNYKLGHVCETFGIPIDQAHNAKSDIAATRQLIQMVEEMLRKGTDNLK